VKWSELRKRAKFWREADRLGPDIPYNHWQLYFPSTMLSLCRRKFRHFAPTAEFRPGAYAIFPSQISIGERVIVRPGTMLFADEGVAITIEDDVLMGSGVHLYTTDHRFDDSAVPIIDQGYLPSEPIVLRRGCWIGANAIILKGVTVGASSVVGAGSVVTRNIPDGVLAVGSPAKVIRVLGRDRTGTTDAALDRGGR
jgi:acetyltransferase-like isoleucine patch superfamily enzyme